MTECEKIEYAKSFLDQLAAGINPIDGKAIPKEDTINHPRLSKCLSYVSGILERVIKESQYNVCSEAPSVIYRPSETKKPVYSNPSISISAIAKQINDTVKPNKKITAKEIKVWLLDEKYLYVKQDRERMLRLPTREGENIGLWVDKRLRHNGVISYPIRCNENARQFILRQAYDIINHKSTSYPKSEIRKNTVSDFFLNYSDLERFDYSDSGLMISQITNCLNDLKPETCKSKLKASELTSKLVELGILKFVFKDGKKYKMPTDAGREMGVSSELRKSDRGEYQAIIYDIKAQHFIVDNLGCFVNVRMDLPLEHPKEKSDSPDTVRALPARQAFEKRCTDCRFARSGECFPQSKICADFEPCFEISKAERSSWPSFGDATAIRERKRKRR